MRNNSHSSHHRFEELGKLGKLLDKWNVLLSRPTSQRVVNLALSSKAEKPWGDEGDDWSSKGREREKKRKE